MAFNIVKSIIPGEPGEPAQPAMVNEDGDVSWFDIPSHAATDPAFAHGGKNGYDDRPMREYLIELK